MTNPSPPVLPSPVAPATAGPGGPAPQVPTPTPNQTASDVMPPGGSSATAMPTTPDESMIGLPGWPLVIILFAAVALGVLIIALLHVRRTDRRPTAPAPAAPAGSGATIGSTVAWEEIDRLVRAYDLATSRTERASVTESLASYGVQKITVDPGTILDSRWHNVVRSTSSTSLGPPQVLEMVRPGWFLPPTTTIRPADVSVSS